MNCRGIGIFLCAAAVLCGCSIQEDHTKGENIRLEILAKVNMLKGINGLYIEDSQRISSTQRCLKDETIMDEKRNHDTDAIQMNIAFHDKEPKQYQARIHLDIGKSGRIDIVSQLKNDVLHVYIVNIDNTCERIRGTPVTSKDREGLLSSLLSQKYRKEAKDYFRYQKQEQDAITVYTAELIDNEKFSEYISKADNKWEGTHSEELKLSYTIDGKTILRTGMKRRHRTFQGIQEQEYSRLLIETTLHKIQRIATSKQSSGFLKLK